MEISTLYNLKEEDQPALSSETIALEIEQYLLEQRKQFEQMTIKQAKDLLVSERNYQQRSQLKSCRLYHMTIRPGDICFIDFGKAYQLEAGYQHFGLVINVFYAKALVIPMTSNYEVYRQSYDPVANPTGLKHIMRIGRTEGLHRYSVLYLNDAKFINTARIIDVKSYINPTSRLFHQVRQRLQDCIEQQL